MAASFIGHGTHCPITATQQAWDQLLTPIYTEYMCTAAPNSKLGYRPQRQLAPLGIKTSLLCGRGPLRIADPLLTQVGESPSQHAGNGHYAHSWSLVGRGL